VGQSNQRAFTWTGPYGGGKSSLAVILGSLLDASPKLRRAAVEAVGEASARKIQKGFGLGQKGWLVVPVVGHRGEMVAAIDDALSLALKRKYANKIPAPVAKSSDADGRPLIDRIGQCARLLGESGDGVLILIDEMGKFLEHVSTPDQRCIGWPE
jgi:hypothetical protein